MRLEGTASNRGGIGARRVVASGGRRFAPQRIVGGSFRSASDPWLHVGLVAADRVEAVEIRWPSGLVDRYDNLTADTGDLLRKGEPAPHPLAGFAAPARRSA